MAVVETDPLHRSAEELAAGLGEVRAAPVDEGLLEMVVARPGAGAREVLAAGRLDPALGLVGDDWAQRGSASTPDGSAEPDAQLTIMSSRLLDLVAGGRDRWPLAGDQLVVDQRLGEQELPVGTRLRLGDAVLEVTPKPHRGCVRFARRFGVEAQRLVASPEGMRQRLRGVYVRVVEAGDVRPGDRLTRIVA